MMRIITFERWIFATTKSPRCFAAMPAERKANDDVKRSRKRGKEGLSSLIMSERFVRVVTVVCTK